MAPPPSRKHHYLPCFYLRHWAAVDGRLCEFSRPHKTVATRRTHPAGTGYEVDLYRDDSLPSEHRSWLEDGFLKPVDQLASDAHRLLLADHIDEMSIEMRSAWSRFVISLVQRNPEKIAWIKDKWRREFARAVGKLEGDYDSRRQPADPPTFEEFRNRVGLDIGVKQLQALIDLRKTGAVINQMVWRTVKYERLTKPLLTSDRPVIMTDGLVHDHSHIVMPISPWHLFVAFTSAETERRLRALGPGELARRSNDKVASQAKKYVYGTDDNQLRFVENRLGRGEVQFVGSDDDQDIDESR